MIPESCIWPRENLTQAWEALLRGAQVKPLDALTPPAPRYVAGAGPREERRRVDDWVMRVADARGLEAQVVTLDATTEAEFFARGAPALVVATRRNEPPVLLAVVRSSKGRVELLSRDQLRVSVRTADVSLAALGPSLPATWEGYVLAALEVTRDREGPAVSALRHGVELEQLGVGYTVRVAASRPLTLQAREKGLGPRAALLAFATMANVGLSMGALYLVGLAVLSGQAHPRGLAAWALLVLLGIPLRLFARRIQAGLVLDASVLMRRRLFEGALHLSLDWVREKGVGTFVALVAEAAAVESLALRAGATSLISAANVLGGLVFLAYAPSPGPLLVLALMTVAVTAYLGRLWVRALRVFTERRMDAAQDLVAKMVGHRTRLVQSRPEEWHAGEDDRMNAKLGANRVVDRFTVMLESVPRAWSVLALVILAPAFASLRNSSSSLMVGAAGTLVFAGALQSLVEVIFEWGRLAVGWKTVGGLIASGGKVHSPTLVVDTGDAAARKPGDVVLDAVGLTYRYRPAGRAALADVSLTVRIGDRVLIEGPSGGGKSTLASVLAGLRRPESGLLLVGGLDHHTQSTSGWRRVVAVAPQFHENYIFLNTLRFNLLLGRPWPPSPEDVARARQICIELGLGPLLAKMPSGLFQMVGESGWQLSHGERSRVYVARALLQDADVVVFDESFGALDPETLMQCISCVFRHGRSLMVIAHP